MLEHCYPLTSLTYTAEADRRMTVTVTSSSMSDLPHALRDGQQFARHLDGGQPAVFLDYDETLTPIVDRPEDAVISESMRDAAGWLTERTIIWVVSGRDRPLVAQWMGIECLVLAGSHGFDIRNHQVGTIPRCGGRFRGSAANRHLPFAQRRETGRRRAGGAQAVLGGGVSVMTSPMRTPSGLSKGRIERASVSSSQTPTSPKQAGRITATDFVLESI